MVFEVRDLWPEMPIMFGAIRSRPAIAAARWLERFAYRNARRIVALGNGLAAGISAVGYPEDRIEIIPNGCDLEMFRVPEQLGHDFRRRYPWLGDRPLVVYTGTLGRANGVDYLARLAAAVDRRDTEIRFLVVGFGCEQERVRETARRVGVLNRNFFMHPPIPKNQMPAALSAADIATVMVVNEPWAYTDSPNKALDALAAGRPVAVNHNGALTDMIRQTGCGLVLPRGDLESAAERLIEAIRSPQWRSRARAAATRVAEERFDRDRLAMTLESVLESVVTGAARDRQQRLAA
jgi:glycosyltransferase involved in cell wall biosynthesis